jgi:mRNA interferase MazF
MSVVKRGDVWWVNFEPAVGGEIRKKRPVVVVSNDAANRHLNRVQVVPLTTQIGQVYPSDAEILVNRRPNKAMADQLTTVSKLRLINRAGRVSALDMHKVERALRVQLGLGIDSGA